MNVVNMFSQQTFSNSSVQSKLNSKQVGSESAFQGLLNQESEVVRGELIDDNGLIDKETNSINSLLLEMPLAFFQHLLEETKGLKDLDLTAEEYVSLVDSLIDENVIEETTIWKSFIATLGQNVSSDKVSVKSEVTRLLADNDIHLDSKGTEKQALKFESVNITKEAIENLKLQIATHLGTLSNQPKDKVAMNDILVNLENTNDKTSKSNEDILKKVEQLLHRFEKLSKNLSNELDIQRIAPKVLDLLEEWNRLTKSLEESATTTNGKTNPDKALSAEQRTIWESLITAYTRRNQLVSNQQYNTNAEVTSKDITRWFVQALEANSNKNNINTSQSSNVFITSASMSKIEQFMIHLNQSQTQAPTHASRQLIEQFQNIIKSSKFMATRNGTEQLSIRLRPNNLGEIMVRMTQINGDMTVKIIVSSQTTKSMLESNIHQLKHMFSPQQVIIEERQIAPSGTEHPTQDLQQENNEQEHSESQKDENQEQSGESFEAYFEEVLLNERV